MESNMYVSYEREELRSYCLSLIDETPKFPFADADDVIHLRALIADVKAAPQLSEIPIDHKTIESDGITFVIIRSSNIEITFEVVSECYPIISNQIKRLKVVKIANLDPQLTSIYQSNLYL